MPRQNLAQFKWILSASINFKAAKRSLVYFDLGDRHLDVTNGLNHLAELYHSQGRYESAEPLYQHFLISYSLRFALRA